MPAIMVCLPVEEDAGPALEEAALLSRGLEAPVSVVQVYPSGWREPLTLLPGAWHLRTDHPVEPLRRFAARNRITHIILGKDGWRRWGHALAAALQRVNGA